MVYYISDGTSGIVGEQRGRLDEAVPKGAASEGFVPGAGEEEVHGLLHVWMQEDR
jgi:hypothetical protein